MLLVLCPCCCALQLKDYVEQVLQLQSDKDELVLQLELVKQQQQRQQQAQQQPAGAAGTSSTSSAAAAASEQELLQLRVQKEQAVAAAVRLKQQLAELFQAATAGAEAPAVGSSAGDADTRSRPGSSAGALVKLYCIGHMNCTLHPFAVCEWQHHALHRGEWTRLAACRAVGGQPSCVHF
jgi:hypothetical protein